MVWLNLIQQVITLSLLLTFAGMALLLPYIIWFICYKEPTRENSAILFPLLFLCAAGWFVIMIVASDSLKQPPPLSDCPVITLNGEEYRQITNCKGEK